MGLEIVGLKLRQVATAVGTVDLCAAPLAGALLALALRSQAQEAGLVLAGAAAVAALAGRLAVRSAGDKLNAPLQPYGRIAAEMAANVIAGLAVAAVLAFHR
jgi:hypothetical protein